MHFIKWRLRVFVAGEEHQHGFDKVHDVQVYCELELGADSRMRPRISSALGISGSLCAPVIIGSRPSRRTVLQNRPGRLRRAVLPRHG